MRIPSTQGCFVSNTFCQQENKLTPLTDLFTFGGHRPVGLRIKTATSMSPVIEAESLLPEPTGLMLEHDPPPLPPLESQGQRKASLHRKQSPCQSQAQEQPSVPHVTCETVFWDSLEPSLSLLNAPAWLIAGSLEPLMPTPSPWSALPVKV